jgi:hypothetical protein
MQWRTYTDPGIFTHGLTKPFDLVAPGGADDVWFTQVGDATQFHDFAAFRAAVLRGPVSVHPRAAVNGLPGGFDVSYASPTEGLVQFGTTGALTVKGQAVPLDTGKRYDNPWALVPFGSQQLTIADKAGSLKLDFATTSRTVASTPEHCGKGHDHHDPGHPGNGHGHECDPG